MKCTAQMTRRHRAGQRSVWVLFVAVIPGSVSNWPEYAWPVRRTAVPGIAQRDAVLKRLGYTRDGDGPWVWCEDEDTEGVMLTASSPVQPLDGAP